MAAAARFTAEERRFWRFARIGDGCWEWQGFRRRHGYGQFDRNLAAHRVAHRLATGHAVLSHLDVCHRCDNPPCVRPSHLFLGTRTDNMRDASRKGRIRNTPLRGEANGRAKLRQEQVAEIRARCAGGEFQKSIAPEYGVSRSLVGAIVRGEVWR